MCQGYEPEKSLKVRKKLRELLDEYNIKVPLFRTDEMRKLLESYLYTK